MTNQRLSLDDLPEEAQRELYAALHKRFAPKRSNGAPSKEIKLEKVNKILGLLSDLALPEQRTILKFASETVEKANNRWWRDK